MLRPTSLQRPTNQPSTSRRSGSWNLAGYVVNEIRVQENAHKAEWARKLIGLALHLDGRNRTALVANHQFKRGLQPKKVETDYKPEPLAKLFIAQSNALAKVGGADNVYLSGLLLAAAVEIDSKNEDAVYELELHKLDIGEIDWDPITEGKARKHALKDQPDPQAKRPQLTKDK